MRLALNVFMLLYIYIYIYLILNTQKYVSVKYTQSMSCRFCFTQRMYVRTCVCMYVCMCVYMCVYMYVGFKTLFYVVRQLDSTASYIPIGLHLGFFRSWPSLYLPSSFSSVFLVLSFVSASTSMLFWVIFFLPFFEHGRTM